MHMQCVAGSLSFKMSHLTLAACPDASSNVRWPRKACMCAWSVHVHFKFLLSILSELVAGSLSINCPIFCRQHFHEPEIQRSWHGCYMATPLPLAHLEPEFLMADRTTTTDFAILQWFFCMTYDQVHITFVFLCHVSKCLCASHYSCKVHVYLNLCMQWFTFYCRNL